MTGGTRTIGLTHPALAGRYRLPPGIEERVLSGDSSESGEEFVIARWTEDPQELSLISRLSRARVVQTLSSGTDWIHPFLPERAVLCSAAGTTEEATAELGVALALASARRIPEFVRDAEEARWSSRHQTSLINARIGIVGFGRLGSRVAQLLSGFTDRIIGFARTARVDATTGIEIRPASALIQSAPSLDVLIVAVPLDGSTRGIVDADVLRSLPLGAIVVNVSRGATVEMNAALDQARSGRIRLASDVWETEPLPATHEAWSTPNALVTPHSGWNTSRTEDAVHDLISEQIASYVSGRTLRNVVYGEASTTTTG